MNKRPDELVRGLWMPRQPGGAGALHVYRKVGTRRAQAITKVGIAALGHVSRGRVTHARIALASVGPTVVDAVETAAGIVGERLNEATISRALETFEAHLHPIDDVRSTERYRRTVATNLVEDFLRQLASR
jgi:CO/xanthine dehydrogenase FAD-binding subunit